MSRLECGTRPFFFTSPGERGGLFCLALARGFAIGWSALTRRFSRAGERAAGGMESRFVATAWRDRTELLELRGDLFAGEERRRRRGVNKVCVFTSLLEVRGWDTRC